MREANCYTQGPPPLFPTRGCPPDGLCVVKAEGIGGEATGSSGIVRLVARAVDAQRLF